MIKTINNFLDEDNFNKLKDMAFRADFYYAPFVSKKDAKDGYYFERNIFYKSRIMSPIFSFIEPVLNKLNVKALVRAKINMYPRNDTLIEFGQHTDTDFKCNTFILSLNTCDGFTRIGKDKKIKSKENTGIYFPSNVLHNGTNCTDQNVRINININYF
jgi:hypothetical protein